MELRGSWQWVAFSKRENNLNDTWKLLFDLVYLIGVIILIFGFIATFQEHSLPIITHKPLNDPLVY